jgi:t-SNARE complex subunit (syntaxin)
MEEVKENAEEAHKELVSAEEHQKGAGKWMCWLIIGILVICLIVILSTVLGIKGKSN